MTEKWLAVVGFEFYEISSIGRIRSIVKRKGSRANVNNGIINGFIQTAQGGYKRRMVALRKDGETHTFRVSHLVLNAFDREKRDGEICRHLNGDPLDNVDGNLKWGTHKENYQDSVKHGTNKNPPIHRGASHPQATLSDDEVAAIRKHDFKRGDQARLAREYNVAAITINRIRNNKTRPL